MINWVASKMSHISGQFETCRDNYELFLIITTNQLLFTQSLSENIQEQLYLISS